MSKEKLDYSELERIEKRYGNKEIWNIIYTEGKLTPHTHPNIYWIQEIFEGRNSFIPPNMF